MLTRREIDTLLFKLEFNLPIVEPAMDALRHRLHLSEKSEYLLERFQPTREN